MIPGGIESILTEEFQKLSRKIFRLRQECSQRPKGSLVVKRRGNYDYVYIVKRVDGRVVTEYLGKAGSWRVKGVEAKVAERRRYQAELAVAEADMAKLEKIMKAGGIIFVVPES